MLKKILSNKLVFLAIFCILSFLGGAINGFVGTGGGMIFVFMLSKMTELDKKDIFATSLCITVLISLASLLNYATMGNVDWDISVKAILPALAGGALGAFLVDKISSNLLSIIFAVLLIYSGVCLIYRI